MPDEAKKIRLKCVNGWLLICNLTLTLFKREGIKQKRLLFTLKIPIFAAIY